MLQTKLFLTRKVTQLKGGCGYNKAGCCIVCPRGFRPVRPFASLCLFVAVVVVGEGRGCYCRIPTTDKPLFQAFVFLHCLQLLIDVQSASFYYTFVRSSFRKEANEKLGSRQCEQTN